MTKGILHSHTQILLVSLIVFLSACTSGAGSTEQFFSRVQTVSVPDSENLSVYLILAAAPDGNEITTPGLSHYTEHLVWLNIRNKSHNDAVRKTNAWTSNSSVVYWFSGSAKDLEQLLSTIVRVFDPITLDRRFAISEREIVSREYDLRLKNNLHGRINQQLNAFLYKGNNSEYSVLGTQNDIENFTFLEATTYHQKTHTQDNAVLLVVGDVSERTVNHAVKNVGLSSLDELPKRNLLPAFQFAGTDKTTLQHSDESATPRYYYRKIAVLENPMEYEQLALHTAVLERMLDSNLPGGIAGPLRFDEFVARSFNLQLFPIDEKHVELRFEAVPDTDVSLQHLNDAFLSVFSESTQGFSQSTFERVRKRFDSYWPDWKDEAETQQWMAEYALNRFSELREPVSKSALKKLDDEVSLDRVNSIVKAFGPPGREASAFISQRE